MAWIKIAQSVWTHRKTLLLADLLQLQEVYAASHMIALWSWALDNAPDGILDFPVAIVERGAQWEGERGLFWESALEAGFIRQDHDGQYVLHGWMEYAGNLLKKRADNAERQRRFQAKRPP